jgi:hypothetical protein
MSKKSVYPAVLWSFQFNPILTRASDEKGECVSGGIGMKVSVKSGQHLESATIVNVIFIFKQKMQLAIFDGQTKLTLPEAAGLKVRRSG